MSTRHNLPLLADDATAAQLLSYGSTTQFQRAATRLRKTAGFPNKVPGTGRYAVADLKQWLDTQRGVTRYNNAQQTNVDETEALRRLQAGGAQ